MRFISGGDIKGLNLNLIIAGIGDIIQVDKNSYLTSWSEREHAEVLNIFGSKTQNI